MVPDGLDLRLRLPFHLCVPRSTAVLALLVTTLLSDGRQRQQRRCNGLPRCAHVRGAAEAPHRGNRRQPISSGLSRVSDSSEAFPTAEVEVFLDLSWKDPRMAFEGESPHVFQGEEAEEKLSEIWSPDPEIQNEVEQRQTESIELILLPDGTIQYEERFGATLNAQLDLGRFPFDTQVFDLDLQSFLWDQGDCVFVVNEAQTGFDRDFETPEWTVTGAEALLGVRTEIRDDRDFSTFTFRIHARRSAGHYVLRFMMPLFFVMGLTWAAFWMPVEHRFRVGFIALLTVVASHTVIARELPRLHYPTFADVLLIICYVFATVLIVVSIRVQHLMDSNREERVAALDRWTRWISAGCGRAGSGRQRLACLVLDDIDRCHQGLPGPLRTRECGARLASTATGGRGRLC